MIPRIILFSGPTGVGKSAVATVLIQNHRFMKISSGQYLKELAEWNHQEASRTGLQHLGDTLDTQTDYRWLIDEVARESILAYPQQHLWLLDSVRKSKQVAHFRDAYGPRVRHIHLTAPETIIRQRYEGRLKNGGEYVGKTPYDVAVAHPNEVEARSLIEIADIVADVSQAPEDVVSEILDKI